MQMEFANLSNLRQWDDSVTDTAAASQVSSTRSASFVSTSTSTASTQNPGASIASTAYGGSRNPLSAYDSTDRLGRRQHNGGEHSRNRSPNSVSISSPLSMPIGAKMLADFLKYKPKEIDDMLCSQLVASVDMVARSASMIASRCKHSLSDDHINIATRQFHELCLVIGMIKEFCIVALRSKELAVTQGRYETFKAVVAHSVSMRSLVATADFMQSFSLSMESLAHSISGSHMVIVFEEDLNDPQVQRKKRQRALNMLLGVGVLCSLIALTVFLILSEAYWALIPLFLLCVPSAIAALFTIPNDGFHYAYWGTALACIAIVQCVSSSVHEVLHFPIHLAGAPVLGYFAFRIQESPVCSVSGAKGGRDCERESLFDSPLTGNDGVEQRRSRFHLAERSGEALGAFWLMVIVLCFGIRLSVSNVSENNNIIVFEVLCMICAALGHYALVTNVQDKSSLQRRVDNLADLLIDKIEYDLSHETGGMGQSMMQSAANSMMGNSANPLIPIVLNDGSPQITSKSINLAGGRLCPMGEVLIEPHRFKGIWRTPADAIHPHVAMVALELRGKILFWNASMESLTNISSEGVVGKNVISLLVPPTTQQQVTSMITAVGNDRQVPPFTLNFLRNHAAIQHVDIEFTATPAKTASGDTIGVILTGKQSGTAKEIISVASKLLTYSDSLGKHKKHPHKDETIAVLNECAVALRDTLPPSGTTKVSDVIGRLMTVHFSNGNVQFDVSPDVPDALDVSEAKLLTLLIESVSHYTPHTTVKLVVGLKQSMDASIKSDTSNGVDRADVTFKVLPHTNKAPEAWSPSPQAVEILNELHGMPSTTPLPNAGRGFRLVGAAAVQSPRGGDRGAVSPGSRNGSIAITSPDDVRCSIALHCSNLVAATHVRNVSWARSHLLYSVPNRDMLSMSLDGIDILFVLVQTEDENDELRTIITDAVESRQNLVIIGILENDTKPPAVWEGVGIDHWVPNPIRVQDVHTVLNHSIRQVAEFRSREEKFKEVKKLLSSSKTCPWVRGKMLGKGTSATVYEATNTITEGKMAVRMVTIDQNDPDVLKATMDALISEITLMSMLDHKNIINYLYCERGEFTLNIFMEYAAGGSLRDHLNKRGPVSTAQLGLWLQDILEGLEYLHSENIAHLDIKAANVLLTSKGTCKLADFGTAKVKAKVASDRKASVIGSQGDSSTTSEHNNNGNDEDGVAAGTMHFMAPEVVARQQYDIRCDVWSLGCMVMELLTGKMPFAHLNAGALGIIGYLGGLQPADQVILPPKITDPEVLSFLKLCLCVDPSRRATCRTLLQHPLICDAPRHRTSVFSMGGRSGGNHVVAAGGASSPYGKYSQHNTSDEDSERRDSCFSQWSAASSAAPQRNPSLQHNKMAPVKSPKHSSTTISRDMNGSQNEADPNFFM